MTASCALAWSFVLIFFCPTYPFPSSRSASCKADDHFFQFDGQDLIYLWKSFPDTPAPLIPVHCVLSFKSPNFFLSSSHYLFPASKFRSTKNFYPVNCFLFQLRWRHLTCLNELCYAGGSSWQDGTCVTTCASCQRGKPRWTPQSCSALRFTQLKGKRQRSKTPAEF